MFEEPVLAEMGKNTEKTIYTFCTSGASPISGSTDDIRSDAKGATVIEGRRFSSDDGTAIKSWLDSLE